MLQTVVETPEFIKQAVACMDEISKRGFINFIAQYPLMGDLISGTGGARKIRWAANNNQGKRGGSRIIYYYHDNTMPIFLFTVYAKNKKIDLNVTEKNTVRKIINLIVETYEET